MEITTLQCNPMAHMYQSSPNHTYYPPLCTPANHRLTCLLT